MDSDKFERDKFERDGYLVLENFASPEEIQKIRNEAERLLNEFDLDSHPKSTFNTGAHNDVYFLESANNIVSLEWNGEQLSHFQVVFL